MGAGPAASRGTAPSAPAGAAPGRGADRPPNPYVGPRSFERGERLYGRDRETVELRDMVLADRIVLLYSPSGAGKTSLVQAALAPALEARRRAVLPVVRVSRAAPGGAAGTGGDGRPPGGVPADTPFNRYLAGTLVSLDNALPAELQTRPEALAGTTLDAYLARYPRAGDPARGGVLIFDQFEEIFSLDPSDLAGRTAFFATLGELLADRRWSALFAMREEFVAELDPFVAYLPTRLAHTYRLALLGPAGAREAIRRPAEAAGVPFDDAAADKLVDDLRTVHVRRPDGSVDRRPGLFVEPVQLQVVCRRLWERVVAGPSGPPPGGIHAPDVDAVGDVDSALGGYFDAEAARAAAASGVPERRLRRWVEDHLIVGGIRGQVLAGGAAAADLADVALDALVDAHLVRAEARRGATWYELAHDRLIQPIRAANAAWFERHLSPWQRRAEVWAAGGRPDAALLDDPALDEAERDVAARTGDGLTDVESAFLADSRAARDARLERSRARRTVSGLLVLLLAAAILAFVAAAFVRLRDAQLADAERQALSRQLAFQSGTYLDRQPDTAALLALAALETADTLEARGSVIAALEHEPRLEAFVGRGSAAGGSAVTGLAFTPDGRRLAGASQFGPIRIWDTATLTEAASIGVPGVRPTLALALDAFGTRLAAAHGGDVTLWSLESYPPAPLATFGADDVAVQGLAFSPDGGRLAVAGKSGLTEWSVDPPGRPLVAPLDVTATVRAVAFAPEGGWFAAGLEDGSIVLWNDRSRRDVRLPGAHAGPVTAVAFAPDGRRLASGGDDRFVRFWDVGAAGAEPADRDPKAQAAAAAPVHGAPVEAVAFRPDGARLASSSRDGTVVLWDAATARPLGPPIAPHGGWVTSLAWSPDDGRIATGDADGRVIRWDPGAESRLGTRLAVHADEVLGVAFDPAGARLASASKDGTAVVWDPAAGGAPLHVLAPGVGELWRVAFSPDGRTLAAAGEDGSAWLWDVAATPPVTRGHLVHASGDPVSGLAFSPEGRWLATGGYDRVVRAWDLASDPPVAAAALAQSGRVWSVAFTPDGSMLVVGDDWGDVSRWDVETWARRSEPQSAAAVHDVAVSADGEWLAIGRINKLLGLGALRDDGGATGARTIFTFFGDAVNAVAFSPDSRWLAAGSVDGTLNLLDVAARRPLGRPLRPHGGKSVNAVAFSPGAGRSAADGGWLATGGDDFTVMLYDMRLSRWRDEACRIANGALEPGAYALFPETIRLRSVDPVAALCDLGREPAR